VAEDRAQVAVTEWSLVLRLGRGEGQAEASRQLEIKQCCLCGLTGASGW